MRACVRARVGACARGCVGGCAGACVRAPVHLARSRLGLPDSHRDALHGNQTWLREGAPLSRVFVTARTPPTG
eukprot:8751267-Alexandrium_andersonii.AAC.1